MNGTTRGCRGVFHRAGEFSMNWETSMNIARHHFTMAAFGDRFIYAIGGEQYGLSKSTERFDV